MKEIVLQPSFYDKFECIGSACKFNCCSNIWEINFTEEEFRNIKRRIKTEEFRKIFQDAFIKEKGQDYYIKFDENGNCKFLDECGLCSMYKEVGSENMSLTCKVFPRVCSYYIDRYECFLSVGCEEVLRLLLEEKDGLMLDVVKRKVTEPEGKVKWKVIVGKQFKDSITYFWNDYRILMLGVLQNREYSFGERMVVLGLAMKKVDEMEKRGEFVKIAKYVENFVIDFNDIKSKDIYSKAFEKVNKDGSIRALNTINCYFIEENKNLVEFDNKITNRIDLKRNLGMGNMRFAKTNVQYNMKKYQEARKDFEEFIKDKEWWIENIIIEGFLTARMPFFIKGGIWKNYCAMVLIYSTILFVWNCCIRKDSTKEDFIYCTSVIARELFHNREYIKKLEQHLDVTESNTLAHMAMLVL